MISTIVASDYLARARDAGLLADFQGYCYVAGTYHDPVCDELELFVEYWDPVIAADDSSFRSFLRQLAAPTDGADALVMRARGAGELHGPMRLSVSYVMYQGEAVRAAREDGVSVTRSRAEDDVRISEWLFRAFENGYAAQRHPFRADAAAEAVRQVMAAPDRRSYVARGDGQLLGHLTVRTAALDEVTAEEYVELVDTLVDPHPAAGTARSALVNAALVDAQHAGKPLVGNVTHPSPGVLESLLARGWTVHYADWRCDWPALVNDVGAV
jgi:hypothetical protein